MTRRPAPFVHLLAATVAVALATAGCQGNPTDPISGIAPNTPPGTPTPPGTDNSSGPDLVCRDSTGTPLPTVPASQRVDLAQPAFSHPTSITNQLFPISRVTRVVQLGNDEGEPLRIETTLLPETRTIEIESGPVETLASQFIAYRGGQIAELAVDFFAQADDGSVWYFGEDVFNYEEGVVVDTDGTWLAGRDGPPGMIMPADPKVGDAWRPENICGLVFEEVLATDVGVTVDGPRGPVRGAIEVRELLLDASLSSKIFAPGYGEFFAASPGDTATVAVAAPTDARPGGVPAELETIAHGAAELFTEAAEANDLDDLPPILSKLNSAWRRFQRRDVPSLLESQMSDALRALAEAVREEDAEAAAQEAINVARAGLDLQLQYRPQPEIDIALLETWAAQLLLDAAGGDVGTVLGDAAVIQWIRARLATDVRLEATAIDAQLGDLRAAADARNMAAATRAASELRKALARQRT